MKVSALLETARTPVPEQPNSAKLPLTKERKSSMAMSVQGVGH